MQNSIKKKFNQLRFEDLAKYNRELGCPIQESVLYWLYDKLIQTRGKRRITVRPPKISEREYAATFLLNNALSKEFVLPDPDIYHYR